MADKNAHIAEQNRVGAALGNVVTSFQNAKANGSLTVGMVQALATQARSLGTGFLTYTANIGTPEAKKGGSEISILANNIAADIESTIVQGPAPFTQGPAQSSSNVSNSVSAGPSAPGCCGDAATSDPTQGAPAGSTVPGAIFSNGGGAIPSGPDVVANKLAAIQTAAGDAPFPWIWILLGLAVVYFVFRRK